MNLHGALLLMQTDSIHFWKCNALGGKRVGVRIEGKGEGSKVDAPYH